MSHNSDVEHEVAPRQVGRFLLWTGGGLMVALLITLLILLSQGHKLPFM